MILFLDFEASSLRPGSWPVEVGWSGDGSETESHLLRPGPSWVDWDPAAHRVVDVIKSPATMVFSDAPSWEQLWLDCLLEEAGLPLDINVHPALKVYQAELRRLLELAPPPEKRWHDRIIRALDTEARKYWPTCMRPKSSGAGRGTARDLTAAGCVSVAAGTSGGR